MKKIYFLLFIEINLILLNGCSKNSSISQNSGTYYMLSSIGATNNSIIKVGNYHNLLYELDVDEVTKEDIDEYITIKLLSEEVMYIVTDRADVQDYDTIDLQYSVYHMGEETLTTENVHFKIGNNEFDSEFEKELIGRQINEEFKFNMVVPFDTSDNLAGKMVTINAIITCIYGFKTDEFDENYAIINGYESIDSYVAAIKNQLITDRELIATKKAEDKMIMIIISNSTFKLNNDSIMNNAIKIVDNYRNLAFIYNMTLNEYILNILLITEDEFYDSCYAESMYEIQKYLIINAIFQREKMNITSDMLTSLCIEYGYDNSIIDINTINTLKYYIEKSMVYNYILMHSKHKS